MKQKTVTMPQIGLFAVTRVALGFGLGLLLSRKFQEADRRGAGWALLTVGALTTIPLVGSILHGSSGSRESLMTEYGFAGPKTT